MKSDPLATGIFTLNLDQSERKIMWPAMNSLDSFPQYGFQHSQLGNLTGIARGSDVVQFRGIPFAEIPGRFRQARLLESLPQQPFDARRSGAYCPQPLLPFPLSWEGGIPADYPEFPEAPQDEFDCLNLSITVSRDALENSSVESLPVLFFIYGGAFIGGSQSTQVTGREIYDGTNLVRAAIARKQPIVVVTSNYRVGPLGFLASKELKAFNKAHGEPVGNYGLHDQRQALEWCNKFIAGFGASTNDTVALLQSIKVDDIVVPVSNDIAWPLIDGEWIPETTMEKISTMYKDGTAPDLMIGACEYQSGMTQELLTGDVREKFYNFASSNGMIVDPERFPDAYPSVTGLYKITSSLEKPSSAISGWADLMADIVFRITGFYIAAHHPANVLVYEIRGKNPYPPSLGQANHAVNDVFLFDVAPDLVPEDLQKAHAGNVAQIRAAWLDFCYGKLPWGSCHGGDDGLLSMHIFEHGETGRDAQTLEDAVGETLAQKWKGLFKAINAFIK
ncbi:alpha/beta-hydrolase [Karstenula rhodostoma CBS 690.94]|uniref:Alpha/beta-hydrolase n=1 Tax=Karstenula rhodostoma CBS 690.94 TaxID=1392251 RepID=A0A9P4PKI3_9PLEO|nr:alpha/beta-hydrolase [Karstenula rhodostoma CBS 690.94]